MTLCSIPSPKICHNYNPEMKLSALNPAFQGCLRLELVVDVGVKHLVGFSRVPKNPQASISSSSRPSRPSRPRLRSENHWKQWTHP